MRKLIFLIFLPVQIFAQSYNYEELYLPINEGVLKYEEVVNAPGLSSETLFNNAKLWFLDTFKSSKDVITFQDSQLGIISGNGLFKIYSTFMNRTIDRTVFFTVRIEVKENRFKYVISDLKVGSLITDSYPVQYQIHPDYLFKKNGKPVQHEWLFAWDYEKEMIGIEQSIKKHLLKAQKQDW